MSTWHLAASAGVLGIEPIAHDYKRGTAACGSNAAPGEPYRVTAHAGKVKQCARCQHAVRERATTAAP